MKELAEERTGAKEGYGSYFILNPKVDDLPEKYSLEYKGINCSLWEQLIKVANVFVLNIHY